MQDEAFERTYEMRTVPLNDVIVLPEIMAAIEDRTGEDTVAEGGRPKTKKRNALIALLLSLITPGLGQMYNARLGKGIIYFLSTLLVPAVFLTTSLMDTFYGAGALAVISLAIYPFIWGDALVEACRKKEVRLRPYNKWYFYVIFIVLAWSAAISGGFIKENISHYKAYKLPTGGMIPSLLVGDHVIAGLEHYQNSAPRRGDIIVFRYPRDPSRDFIKRVVAVGGDVIESRDKTIYLNGSPVREPYIRHTDKAILKDGNPRDNFGPVTVPEGKYFVMGDNRDQSYDSRYWGFVDSGGIRGKALYIYWSYDRETHSPRADRIGKVIQ